MTREQLEFAISQYLDGTLPPEERAALQRLLESDAAAQRLLEEYLALDRLLKSEAMPEVRWDRLAKTIGQAVTGRQPTASGGQSADQPLSEELEYSITQYVDGELPADEQAALEARLASDPAAQRALAEHQALDTVVKHAWPLPHIEWDRLREHLCNSVGDEAAPSSYSISLWLGRTAKLAMAACVLLAIGVVVRMMLPTEVNPLRPQLTVIGPTAEAAEGVAVIRVEVGPAATARNSQFDPYLASGIVTTSRRVAMDISIPPPDESELPWLPY